MSQFFSSAFDYFFGCSHKKTTFPLTEARTSRKRTYVVCLNCGKEFDYSWKTMKVNERTAEMPAPVSIPIAH